MTFSQRVKQEITSLNHKTRNCCAYSFLYGMIFPCVIGEEGYKIKTTFVENAKELNEKMENLLNKHENAYQAKSREILIKSSVSRFSTIAEINENILKCPRCTEHFLKGIFFSCGTISSPEKSHRLDLVFANFDHANELKKFLLDKSLKLNLTIRNNKAVLYIKRCEDIEDFLALMGANSSAFDMINSKINHEVRNVANRATNCDSANINKSLNAAKKHIDIINEIIKLGHFNDLPISLQEIARARIDFPDANIQELGKRLTQPISKSGVHHRLEKIVRFYENLEKK